jgi:hypothetical protein
MDTAITMSGSVVSFEHVSEKAAITTPDAASIAI